MTPSVVVYVAQGCHLCDAALAVVDGIRQEVGFALSVVDIGGDPDLEAAHRAWLPVVEIDGERAFAYHVQPEALRERLRRRG